jgi:hypothetical protein
MKSAFRVVALILFAAMLVITSVALFHCLPHLTEVTCGCLE